MSIDIHKFTACFPNSNPIGGGTGGGGGVVDTDYSLYTNGVTETKIDFVDNGSGTFAAPAVGSPSAPYDRFVGADYVGSYINMSTTPFLHTTEWVVEFTVQAISPLTNTSVYIETNTGDADILMKIATGTSDATKLFVFLRSASGSVKSSVQSITLFPFDGNVNRCKLERVSNSLVLTVNGVSEVIDSVIGGGSLDAGDTATISRPTNDFRGDVWDFDLNGTSIPIDEGVGTIIHDTTNNVVGALIDPSVIFWDKYISYNDGTGELVPEVGGMDMSEDTIVSDAFTDVNLSDGTERLFVSTIEVGAAPYTDGDRIFEISKGTTGVWLQYFNSSNQWKLFWYDDSVVLKAEVLIGLANIPVGVKTILRLTISSTLLSLEINGILYEDSTIAGGASNVNAESMASTVSGSSLQDLKLYEWQSAITGKTIFERRLPTQSDVDGNKLVSDTGTVFTLTDNSPFGAFFPYIGLWNTYYLEEDVVSSKSSGQQQLQLIDSVAEWIQGEFQFITVP